MRLEPSSSKKFVLVFQIFRLLTTTTGIGEEMHIGKVMGSRVGWQTLKERAMQGLTMFQEYVAGVFAFLNNFVCVDKSACGTHLCRGHSCHEGPSTYTSLEYLSNSSIKYLEDYSDEELIAMLNYTLYRPCNASEEFDRACLYDSPCIAYLLPDNVVELVCNCTPGWKGEQCELADMDDAELGIQMGGFQVNILFLLIIYLLVDFGLSIYFSYHSRSNKDKDLLSSNRRPPLHPKRHLPSHPCRVGEMLEHILPS